VTSAAMGFASTSNLFGTVMLINSYVPARLIYLAR
jgi:hypothetical protein